MAKKKSKFESRFEILCKKADHGKWKEVLEDSNELGNAIRSENGSINLALEVHELELKAAEETDAFMDKGVAHRNITECHIELGAYESALKSCNQYLALAEALDNVPHKQIAHHTLARIYIAWTAEEGCKEEKKQEYLRKAQSSCETSKALCNKSLMTASALNLSEEAAHQDRLDRIIRLLQLSADVAYGRDDIAKGHQCINQALAIYGKLNASKTKELSPIKFKCHYSMSEAMQKRTPRDAKTLKQAEKTLEIARNNKIGGKETCDAALLLAQVCLVQHDFPDARKHFKFARKCNKDTSKTDAIELQLKRAIKLIQLQSQLDEFQDSHSKAQICEQMGDAMQSRDSDDGVEFYEDMEELLGQSPQVSAKEWHDCFESIATTYKSGSNFSKALEYYKKTIDYEKDDPTSLSETYRTMAVCASHDENLFDEINEYFEQSVKHGSFAQKRTTYLKWRQFLHNRAAPSSLTDRIERELKRLEKMLQNDEAEEEAESQGLDYGDDLSDIDLDQMSDSDDDEEMPSARNLDRLNLGENELHRAARNGNIDMMRKLFNSKVYNLNKPDVAGWTPLHEAANHNKIAAAKLLLDRGANPNSLAWDCNKRGQMADLNQTPVMDAAMNGHLDMVRMMVERGADVTLEDFNKWTVAEYLLHFIQANQDTSDVEQEWKLLEWIWERQKRAQLTPKQSLPSLLDRKSTHSKLSALIKSKTPKPKPSKSPEIAAVDTYRKTIEQVGSKRTTNRSPSPPTVYPDDVIEDDADWLEDDIVLPRKKKRSNSPPQRPKRPLSTASQNSSLAKRPSLEIEPQQPQTVQIEPWVQQLVGGQQTIVVTPGVFAPKQPEGGVTVELEFWEENMERPKWRVIVPVQKRETTIEQFMEIAEEKFKNKFGQKPAFNLFKDGYEVDSGTINDYTNDQNKSKVNFRAEISGYVSESFAKQYKMFCAKGKLRCYDNIGKILETAEEMRKERLDLSALNLTKDTSIPVFRALQQPNCILKELILCRNRLSYESMEHLAKTVLSLDLLKVLDLSCTGLCSNAVERFVTELKDKQLKLVKLDLSSNPLDSASFSTLQKLKSQCPSSLEIILHDCTKLNIKDLNQISMPQQTSIL